MDNIEQEEYDSDDEFPYEPDSDSDPEYDYDSDLDEDIQSLEDDPMGNVEAKEEVPGLKNVELSNTVQFGLSNIVRILQIGKVNVEIIADEFTNTATDINLDTHQNSYPTADSSNSELETICLAKGSTGIGEAIVSEGLNSDSSQEPEITNATSGILGDDLEIEAIGEPIVSEGLNSDSS